MSRAALGATLAAIASSICAQTALATAGQRGRVGTAWQAHSSRTFKVSDRGKLRYRSVAATSILDEGALSGTIPGHARVDFLYDGSPNVTARFTIYAAGGSIDGQAHCRLHNPASPTPSFKGALQITGGSGRYSHAAGSGELYGVFYRRGYGLSVQATGELHD
jgi:hypothetical protein